MSEWSQIGAVALSVLALLGCNDGRAEPPAAETPAAETPAGPAAAPTSAPAVDATMLTEELQFPEVELLDHRGRPVSFHRDLVAGKVVVINFIFTSCGMICPPMGANFAALDRELLEHGPQDVQLLSVSVDPVTDTPERLAEWKQRFSDTERWTLVTGPKPEIDRLLKALRSFTPDREDHSPIVLVGNDATGHWMRANGLAQARLLAGVVRDVAKEAS